MVINIDIARSNDTGLDITRAIGEKGEKKKLVLIKWRDVLSDASWTLEKDVNCPVICSVGWLVSDDGETLKIASTLDLDNFSEETKDEAKPIPYGITAFPKGCVTEIKFI
jgi:hypothetical protein